VTQTARIGDILTFLRESDEHVSGTAMAARLGISRTAVWKYLRHLEEYGYAFEHRKGQGYRITSSPDRLRPWEIDRHLTTGRVGRDIVYRETVDSTNTVAFRLALDGAAEGACVVAEYQEAGRGRLKRKWHSPFGKNVYVSIILRPPVHPSQVYPLTFISSLAVFDLLADLGVTPRLKWPNDVLVEKKKICGTLIELSAEPDAVRFVVVGVGLNVNVARDDLSDEINEIATSLFMETKKPFERALVCGMLLNNLERYYDIFVNEGVENVCRLWEERAKIRDTYMEIRQFDVVHKGTCVGIDRDGAILLRNNNNIIRVIAGDATV
jgi:BirA family transcriptional regulator, biotin operon repressor / biotin---[acetyl-CoA-carboxylase] ligase